MPTPPSRVIFAAVLAGILLPLGTAVSSAAAAQTVQLPYVMRDNIGVAWDVQMDGSIADGGNDLYDGGGRMDLNNAVYNSPQQQVQFDAAANELTFPPVAVNGLNVSRKVAVNAAQSWCRYTEVLRNDGGGAVHTVMHLHWDLGGSVQQFQAIEDEKKKAQLGVAIFDGQRGLAMLCAGRGGKITSRYQMQQNSDQIEQYYDIDVPPKQTVVIVHFQAMRATIADAATFIQQTKDKELLAGIDKDLTRSIANFKHTESVFGDLDLPRNDLLDVVELASGDQYRGTLKDPSFKLETFHGPVELPAADIIGMVSAGAVRPLQLFVTREGEIVGGRLVGDSLHLQLTSGQVIALPIGGISRVGCRKRPGETELVKFEKPMVVLRDGQRLLIDPPAGMLSVATLYGNLQLRPDWVASLQLTGEEQIFHQVRLKDGSRFNGLLSGDSVELRLRGAGSVVSPGGSPQAVKIPLSGISQLLLVPTPAEPADEDEIPAITLANGDLLVGTASGTLEIETGFDVLKLAGSEIRGIQHLEPRGTERSLPTDVTVTLWDGATISGRLRGDAADFALRCGVSVRSPVALMTRYANPEPAPPPAILERIRGLVGELNHPDWKTRQRAAERLHHLGQPATAILKEMRDTQPPEPQKQIDTLLKTLAQEKKEAKDRARASAAAPPAAPGMNQAVDFDGPVINGPVRMIR